MASLFNTGNVEVKVASGDLLDVREFTVHERMSALFEIALLVVCDNPDVDLEAVVGHPATFTVRGGPGPRVWTGLCDEMHQIAVEPGGLSTYHVTIAPTLWLATQRRNHRMFQQLSELDIVLELLAEWSVEPEKKITQTYKKRKYKVQYGETDFAFVSRMLEEAGISFYFEQKGDESTLVLSDAPEKNEERMPIAFRDNPTHADREVVTNVRVGRRIRPGKHTIRDHDHRKDPSYKLLAAATSKAPGVEQRIERFHYIPGAFLFGTDRGEDTPHADDRGKTRTDEAEGALLAQKRLDADRSDAGTVELDTNVFDLAPGVVTSLLDHPRSDLGPGKRLLVVASTLTGRRNEDWSHHVEARSAATPYRPPITTPKPRTMGVESATVVGPAGEEIHTDEFGRVRVHFHWDRESQMDERSSCWIHVSQPWGGTGYGGTNLPRTGQEVLVDFLGGDPDRPIITGRVYTNLQKTPYKLPDNKTQSGWKSNSTHKTGGYNELMFEDAAGRELMRIQAERDQHKLVKNDEQSTVGHDRTRCVGNDEDLTVGHDRSRRVGNDERIQIGKNQSLLVGVNRSAQIGTHDTTDVGSLHRVTMSDGTGTSMVPDKIELSTAGGAKITLEGSTITLEAKTILVTASDFLGAVSFDQATFGGANSAHLGSASGPVGVSAGGDVTIKGGPWVKINP